MNRHLLLALLLATLTTSSAFADDTVDLEKIGLAGNGCPEETESIDKTSVELNDNSVRITPTQFVLSSKLSKRKLIRKKCDMAIAVEVPDGYQIGISNASMQAFLELFDTSKSTITMETGFTGEEFEKKQAKFASPIEQDAELTNDSVQWSNCGQDTIIRMKVSAILRADKAQLSHVEINSFGLDFEYRVCS